MVRLLLAALGAALLVGACQLSDLSTTLCNEDGSCGEGYSCVKGRCLLGIAGEDAAFNLPFNLDGGALPSVDSGVKRDAGQPRADAATTPDAATALDAATSGDAASVGDAASPPPDAATEDVSLPGVDAAAATDAAGDDAGLPPDAS